jgi:NADPH-dependent curcumin reductase CurA
MSIRSKKILLIKRPSGELGKECFSIENGTVPNPSKNEISVRTLFLSVDPYMRNRMNDILSYVAPYRLNDVLHGDGICQVMESQSLQYKVGDILAGILPWQQYAVLPGSHRLEKIEKTTNLNPTTYLSVLGLTGLTAYFGIIDIAQPKKGETVVISGAAGAVGSVAGQIANIKGCRVIGITGSEKKTDFIMRDLGFDDAINYSEVRNIRKPLRKSCPDGVDVYFDNVGGEISDAVIYQINDFARIVLCGQISLYNQNRLVLGPRLLSQLIIHRARMQGYIVYDYAKRYPEARRELKKWIQTGKLINTEQIIDGFEKLPDALISLFSGANTGKLIVRV